MASKILKDRIRGVVVVMVTPFRGDYELDEEGLRKLTRFLIESGVREGWGVLVPAGSTGECPMLTLEERKKVFAVVKEEAGDAVPVLGGCNHCDTREVIKLARYAEEIGLDGIMVSPPYYWKPDEKTILTHYRAIAEATNLGIMVYNNWFASQLDIPVDTMVRLVEEIPSIVALKENTPFIAKFAEMVRVLGDKIAVINGAGEPHEPYAALMGAKGFVSGIACLIPKTCLSIYRAELAKDYEGAKRIVDRIAPLVDFFTRGDHEADYILKIKAIMNSLGLPGGFPRLPFVPVSEEVRARGMEVLGKLLKEGTLVESWGFEE
ncbi:MAG: dihydrodipicolinate synthase family protein [candidate division WOR-3 bacterium]